MPRAKKISPPAPSSPAEACAITARDAAAAYHEEARPRWSGKLVEPVPVPGSFVLEALNSLVWGTWCHVHGQIRDLIGLDAGFSGGSASVGPWGSVDMTLDVDVRTNDGHKMISIETSKSTTNEGSVRYVVRRWSDERRQKLEAWGPSDDLREAVKLALQGVEVKNR